MSIATSATEKAGADSKGLTLAPVFCRFFRKASRVSLELLQLALAEKSQYGHSSFFVAPHFQHILCALQLGIENTQLYHCQSPRTWIKRPWQASLSPATNFTPLSRVSNWCSPFLHFLGPTNWKCLLPRCRGATINCPGRRQCYTSPGFFIVELLVGLLLILATHGHPSTFSPSSYPCCPRKSANFLSSHSPSLPCPSPQPFCMVLRMASISTSVRSFFSVQDPC